MNEQKNDRVASTFITIDRTLAAFDMRMDEHGRTKLRVAVMNDVRAIVRKHGFEPYLIGGFYVLLGELAKMVAHSLVTGLGWLMLFLRVLR